MSTKANRERFLAHLKYWKKALNLSNYTIEVSYNYEDVGGECAMDHSSLTAVIRIGEVDEIWTEPVIARHEMLELLLEPMQALLFYEVHENKSYRAGHEVVHRLEAILPLPSDKEVGYMPCGKKKKKPKGK